MENHQTRSEASKVLRNQSCGKHRIRTYQLRRVILVDYKPALPIFRDSQYDFWCRRLRTFNIPPCFSGFLNMNPRFIWQVPLAASLRLERRIPRIKISCLTFWLRGYKFAKQHCLFPSKPQPLPCSSVVSYSTRCVFSPRCAQNIIYRAYAFVALDEIL